MPPGFMKAICAPVFRVETSWASAMRTCTTSECGMGQAERRDACGGGRATAPGCR